MAKSKLGRKALSVFTAVAMVVSLNAPISAWAGGVGEADESAPAEQSQPEGALAVSPQAVDGVSVQNDGVAALIVGGDTQDFSSVQAAVDAAPDGVAATVWLNDNSIESVTIPAGKNITLDLNGFTLTGKRHEPVVVNNGTLLVADTKQPEHNPEGSNGTIQPEQAHDKSALVNNGAMTISGGIISGTDLCNAVQNNAGATLVINGGSLSSEFYAVENRGTTIIRGGEFESSDCVLFTSSSDGSTDSLTVTGGTFTAQSSDRLIKSGDGSNQGHVTVSGGTFSPVLSIDYCADGYAPGAAVDGKSAVVPCAVQVVDDDGNPVGTYNGLQSAIGSEGTDKTKTFVLAKSIAECILVASDKWVTIDLNGKTLSSNDESQSAIALQGHLTITDSRWVEPTVNGADVSGASGGKVTATGDVISMSSGSRFTLESGMLKSTQGRGIACQSGDVNNDRYKVEACINGGYVLAQSHAVYIDGDAPASVIMTGGVLESQGGSAIAGKGFSSGTLGFGGSIEVSGGNLIAYADGIDHLRNSVIEIAGGSIYSEHGVGINMGEGKLEVTGGAVMAASGAAAIQKSDGNEIPAIVTGGTFSSDVSAFVKSGSVSAKGSDGVYTVLEVGATAGSGVATGSVAVDGVDVGQNEKGKLAKIAAEVASALKNGGVPGQDGKIGGIVVDTSYPNYSTCFANVKSALDGDSGTSVNVLFVVRARQGSTTDQQIIDAIDASRTKTIPFVLSADMVTEVKNSEGTVVANESVPVKEMAQPVEVKVAADLSAMNGKKISIAYAYGEAVGVIEPTSVDFDDGSVTFEADKFSNYAVLCTDQMRSYDLANYTDENGKRTPIDNTKFGLSDDYAFAGWFKDAAFTSPYSSGDVSGEAYPKFVKVDTLILFKGGSLRMDFKNEDGTSDYSKTSLRFGYEMHVPTGATLDRDNWGWTMLNPDSVPIAQAFVPVENYWPTESNGAIANVVVTPIPVSSTYYGYKTAFQATAQVVYTTQDGTYVVAKDQTRARSVEQVAKLICENTFVSSDELTYARGILGALTPAQ